MTVRQHRGMTLYGMPDQAELSKAVVVLTRPHTHTTQGITGVEEGLLVQLERAIGSDQGRGSVSGVSGASGVLNLSALELWQAITATVAEFWPGRGDLARAKTHLVPRLQQWTEQVAGTDSEVHLLEMCDYWAQAIRDLLDPPKRVPIRGGQCPRCKEHQVLGTDPDGQRVYQPCLLAHISEDPVRVECLGCGGTWYGNTQLALLELALTN